MRRLAVVLVVLGACNKKTEAPAASAGSAAGAGAGSAVAVAVAVPIDAPPPPPPPPPPPVDAAVPEVPCEVPAIKAQRKAADALVKAGKLQEAITLLDGYCALDEEMDKALAAQVAWRISDLAFAHYKAGELEACYAVAGGQLMPYHGNVADVLPEDHAVMKALQHNADLCHDKLVAQRGPFLGATDCDIDGVAGADADAEEVDEGEPSGPTAAGLPPSMVAATDADACIEIGAQKKDADDLLQCGAVTLVTKSKAGKVTRTPLEVTEGVLADSGSCCNMSAPSFQKRGGSFALLVTAAGRNCDGGTASTESEDVYELKGKQLELVDHVGVSHH